MSPYSSTSMEGWLRKLGLHPAIDSPAREQVITQACIRAVEFALLTGHTTIPGIVGVTVSYSRLAPSHSKPTLEWDA